MAELKRRRDLETLRVFLKHDHCFAPSANPDTAQINMDDLKKLARAWKLHERRNFWKLHAEKESMVAVLLQHAHETRKFDKMGHAAAGKDGAGEHQGGDDSHSRGHGHGADYAVGGALPVPPRDPKPSATSPHPLGATTTVRNFCGLHHFNREVLPNVLALQSRFDAAPEPTNTVDSLIDKWRGQNFSISKGDDNPHGRKKSAQHSSKDKDPEDGDSDGVGEAKGDTESQDARRQREKKRQEERKKADEAEQKKASAAAKRAKHRNLANHLAFYSSSEEFLRLRIADSGDRAGDDDDDEEEEDADGASAQLSKSSGASSTVLDMKTVQTFANVADTDDPLVASYCFVALCNIASVSAVRNLLLETNVLHKLATMLAHVRDPTAGWCACLVFCLTSPNTRISLV